VVVKNWRFLAFLGLFEAAGSLLFTYGILISGPTNAAFVAQFTVVFTILFGVIFLKEKLANREVLGVVVALVGLFILTSGSVQLEIFSTVAVLISAVLFAAANLFSKVYIKDINPMSMAGGRSFFMLIILLIYALALGKLETAISPLTLGYAILGSVTGVILSFIFFFKALEVFEISKTMTIRSMEPLLTAVFSFALLALVPTMNQLIGGILIVSGVVALSYTAR
jgi:uncharacterized membrane protein